MPESGNHKRLFLLCKVFGRIRGNMGAQLGLLISSGALWTPEKNETQDKLQDILLK